MALIIVLIVIAMFLLAVELVLLPGVTIAGIGALGACVYSVYKAFDLYGPAGGWITIAVILLLAALTIVICLRAKTWRKLALNKNVEGTSQQLPQEMNIAKGDRGTTVTRLAPIGKVRIGDETFEAKSVDIFIDQKREVEVVGFENFDIIVKLVE